MTKKLEEVFNISKNSTDNEIQKLSEEMTMLDNLYEENEELVNFSKDMDSLAETAVTAAKDMIETADAVSSRDAGSIYSAAVAMMKNAIIAKNSKISASLKFKEHALKKEKLSKEINNLPNNNIQDNGDVIFGNRNDILSKLNEDE